MRFAVPASRVWEHIGALDRIQEWFPGIVDSKVEETLDGTVRTITTGTGIPMPEAIVTLDHVQRRLQYRLMAGFIREHLSTLDVIDLGDGGCLAVYGVDANPAPMALVIGGAAGNALEHLRDQLEGER